MTNIVLPFNSTLLILRNSNLISIYKAVVIIWDDVLIIGYSQCGIINSLSPMCLSLEEQVYPKMLTLISVGFSSLEMFIFSFKSSI